jgi:titin
MVSSSDPPSQPRAINIVEVFKHHIVLEWQKPKSDGGSKITGYTVERRQPSGYSTRWQAVNSQPIQACELKMTDCSEGHDYEFRVIAENEAGISEPSMATGVVTAKDPWGECSNLICQESIKLFTTSSSFDFLAAEHSTNSYSYSYSLPSTTNSKLPIMFSDAPDAPGKSVVTNFTEDSCSLKWAAPEHDGGAPVKFYVLEMKRSSDYRWSVVNDNIKVTEFTVSHLRPETDYEFHVLAENKAGVSRPSESSGIVRYGKCLCQFMALVISVDNHVPSSID